MAYIRREYLEFSWSYSRKNSFHDCLRKYYYHYYASHNGWEDNIKLFAIPNLIYRDSIEDTIIVDWKTGKYNPNYDKEQLYIYAYYYFKKYDDSKAIKGMWLL